MVKRSASVDASRPASGKLAIIGGRLEDDNRSIYREIRRLSEGRILVAPTASSEPESVGEETVAAFRMHGVQADILPVYTDNKETAAFDESIISQIGDYGSVYFTGGDQAKILSALIQNGEETPALAAIRRIYAQGGLIAGSSAGAAMMSDPMILGGTSFEAMFHGRAAGPEQAGLLLGPGLGFFPYGVVDQHFIKRGRLARLVVGMAHAGLRRGFGVDENTALIIEDGKGLVVGEYGVFLVDAGRATIDLAENSYHDLRISYLDDGDAIILPSCIVVPSESKRRVKKNEIAYRSPVRSQRNAFGAYALYDLAARLVLGDPASYTSDSLAVIDPSTSQAAQVTLSRKPGTSRCLVAQSDSGFRISAVNFRGSLSREPVTPEMLAMRGTRGVRTFGMDLNERSQIILLGSSLLYCDPAVQQEIIKLIGPGPVGIIAAASAEARTSAEEHVEFFARYGVEASDLGITIDTVESAARDSETLNRIASTKAFFLCGGNQTRLVETLLHRGEESAVLRAIAQAYAHGATLVASSGAVSALSRIMIAGGTSMDALRYGVASDLGHPGLVIQEGVGLFSSAVADQNIVSARRLARLVVACAEENERFGIGVCDESAVIAVKSGKELTAAGRYGFVQVDTERVDVGPFQYGFVAKGVKLRMFAPGDKINLNSGHITRVGLEYPACEIFDLLIEDLQREQLSMMGAERALGHRFSRHSPTVRLRRDDLYSATLDLECPREEFAQMHGSA